MTLMMFKKPDIDREMVDTVSEVVAKNAAANKRILMTIQYECKGMTMPLADHAAAILYKQVMDECSSELVFRCTHLSQDQIDYILIPTLMHEVCGWCPKNPKLYDKKRFNVIYYKLKPCKSEIARHVLKISEQVPDGCKERETLHTKFYEDFWNFPANRALLEMTAVEDVD